MAKLGPGAMAASQAALAPKPARPALVQAIWPQEEAAAGEKKPRSAIWKAWMV